MNVTSNPFSSTQPLPPTPSSADPSGSVDTSSDDDFAAGLSPDALMSYCQTRLDSIDGQIKESFASQQNSAAIINQITSFADTLHGFNSDVNGASDCRDLETQFQTTIQSIQTTDPNCAALPDIIKAYNTMVYSGDGGAAFLHSTSGPDMIDPGQYPPSTDSQQGNDNLSTPELQGYTTTLTDAASNLNSAAELSMVQLQALMSQRQTAISLTTNLVQSLGDQENKIADNIGH